VENLKAIALVLFVALGTTVSAKTKKSKNNQKSSGFLHFNIENRVVINYL
jgi:hypothetical protein